MNQQNIFQVAKKWRKQHIDHLFLPEISHLNSILRFSTHIDLILLAPNNKAFILHTDSKLLAKEKNSTQNLSRQRNTF